jgi:hypothetical protein
MTLGVPDTRESVLEVPLHRIHGLKLFVEWSIVVLITDGDGIQYYRTIANVVGSANTVKLYRLNMTILQ